MATQNDPQLKTVVKADGSHEDFDETKASNSAIPLLRNIDITLTTPQLFNRILLTLRLYDDEDKCIPAATKLSKMVELAYTASELVLINPIFSCVATSVERMNIYKATESTFTSAMEKAWSLLSPQFLSLVWRHRIALDKMTDDSRDSLFSHAALNSFKRTYALKDGTQILERPQYLFLRTALQVHGDDIPAVKHTYDMISTMRFMPASPFFFNSGTPEAQLSSCFLLSAESDSDDIFETLSQAAKISREGGGIGLGLQCIPSQGSKVHGIERCGLPPVLKMLDAAVDVVDQGVNKRPTAITVYVEPWHADILSVVRMRRLTGGEANHTERLFYGLWINDLFMKRVRENKDWTLFCPSQAYHLIELYGNNFDEEYERLEGLGRGRRSIKARDLWKEILTSQVESGGPFILYKDAVNEKSNERHLGTITHANLCTEIVQSSGPDETAVCNLASVVLPTFVKADRTFDFATLEATVRQAVLFLNCAIKRTHPPTANAKSSMEKQRAIGIGVQGLADAFAKMGYPFDSEDAFKLNTQIAETIYYAAVDESCELISRFGTYPTFKDSHTYYGWLQFDFWENPSLSARYNWSRLQQKVKRGMANSLLVAYMPTAGTTQLTGCSEGFEPYTSLVYLRKVQKGEFTVVPYPLVERLQELDLWNESMIDAILSREGSIQSIDAIPTDVRAIFKTAWEIDPSVLVKMAAARAPFICQSQSMSLFFKSPTLSEISKALFLGWRLGLKTGMYYLRTRPASRPLPMTLPVSLWASRDEGDQASNGVDDDTMACIACTA